MNVAIYIIGIALLLGIFLAAVRYCQVLADESRQRDEWSRQLARGMTSKRYEEWKLSRDEKGKNGKEGYS